MFLSLIHIYILGGRNTYNYFLGDFPGHKNYDRDVLVVCDCLLYTSILRSHKVLNNLHQAFVRCPVVMFFPGTYNEQELILFNEIKDDNYYREMCIRDRPD